MKNRISLLAAILIMTAYVLCRMMYTEPKTSLPIKVTTWDALGYYLYLPSTHIYHDDTSFAWFSNVDGKYQLSGGEFYQATKHSNGNLVYKYLRGVSILQTPFYYLAHAYCTFTKQFPADGFSYPYQLAIACGALIYFFLSLLLLRWVLLQYYSDAVVALSLLLLTLASNSIQYIAIEGGQSHAYIFPLYVLILYLTFKWHQQYRLLYIFAIGCCIGLASISRPTEAIMLFIPLLWNVSDKEAWKSKWKVVKAQPLQWLLLVSGGFAGIAPQLTYWKRVTGSWIYDVGSKWDFLNPHFRVLFGPEKGWFIYTPVAILFVVGLFFIRQKPFRTAVITFCLLNIYIIIAWHIWRYGGSYSTRALVQSYPVFALPLCGLIEFIWARKSKWLLMPIGLYLIGVNLFQVFQYNRNILHYDEMNFAYYKAIYLNPNPGPKEMSLLDTKDYVHNESLYNLKPIYVPYTNDSAFISLQGTIENTQPMDDAYLKAELTLKTASIWGRYISLSILADKQVVRSNRIRLFHSLAKENQENNYLFYTKIPKGIQHISFVLSPEPPSSDVVIKEAKFSLLGR